MERKLQRIPHEGAVAGVCAGLGDYFSIDKTWVRLFFVVSVCFSGFMGIGLLGPIAYIVLWVVLPVKPFVLPENPFDVNYQLLETGGRQFGEQPVMPQQPKVSKDRYVAGLVILGIGIFFLLHQLDLFYWHDVAKLWPILLIAVGLITIFGAFNRRSSSSAWDIPEQDRDEQQDEGNKRNDENDDLERKNDGNE